MAAVGAAAWLLPAFLAIAGCIAVGWVRIELVVDPTALLLLVAAQVPLVLLLEARPEEVVFRGYLLSGRERSLTAVGPARDRDRIIMRGARYGRRHRRGRRVAVPRALR
jgi:hypothetical protein